MRNAILKAAQLLCLSISCSAAAADLSVGASLGFGGGGISSLTTINSSTTTVNRSEGPGTFSFFVDYLIHEHFTLGVEHLRGFRLEPFSSGVSFTGVTGRWYFMAPAPNLQKTSLTESTLHFKRFTPFLGLSTGVASGTIHRDRDLVPDITGSGVYFGYRLGLDYQIAPGFGLRPEIAVLNTLSSAASPKNQVAGFTGQLGIFFYL